MATRIVIIVHSLCYNTINSLHTSHHYYCRHKLTSWCTRQLFWCSHSCNIKIEISLSCGCQPLQSSRGCVLGNYSYNNFKQENLFIKMFTLYIETLLSRHT